MLTRYKDAHYFSTIVNVITVVATTFNRLKSADTKPPVNWQHQLQHFNSVSGLAYYGVLAS